MTVTEQRAGLPAEPPTARPPDSRALHLLLLGLAGRIPDDVLAELRMSLADGEERRLAHLLGSTITAHPLALTAGEAAMVRAVLLAYDENPGQVDGLPLVERPPRVHRFGDAVGAGAGDRLDAAVVEAGRRAGGMLGVWRAFRHAGPAPAERVYLAEADSMADAPEIVAEMQYVLAEMGTDVPRVEVFLAGTGVPPYHEAALAAGTLVWCADEPPPRLARTFDGVHGLLGPFFRPDHPRLDDAVGEQVLAYLRAAEIVLTAPGALDDVLDPGCAEAVPVGFRSDGRWIWSDALAYYLKRHRVSPEPELVAHILGAAGPPPALGRVARHRTVTALFAPDEVEPVWQAG
jgi:hypothetical protein